MNNLFLNDTKVSDIWSLQFMKDLKDLELQNTQVIDLHPLQYLNKLERICISYANVIDVTPLSNLTLLDCLFLISNKIQSFDCLAHHKYYVKPKSLEELQNENEEEENENDDYEEKYSFDFQNDPTDEELKFYDKILSVHSSHKQIRKIKNDNKQQKFRTSLALQKNYVSVMLNNQIMRMNKQLEIALEWFNKNSNTLIID
ncbi:leucine-rich_repeat domain-containing protein [Hexamita inflata]|uniref:Leucine-rich repeat domain-containing protein n=1 Tax=Hexamita inflata TaxID=28002 RepID=A0AA86R8D8_9EUKA|nr:leucine-rich repeat domain-containing protein [Hexamita inflata]